MNPRASIYHVNLANILFETGNLDESAGYFQKTLDLDMENRDAINGLTMVLNEQGRYETAIEYFHKVLRLNPEYVETYNNLGIAYL